MQRKSRSREPIEKLFQKIRLNVVKNCNDKTESLLRQLRSCRVVLAHDYLQELTGQVCLDFLKLELMHESTEMRRRAYLLPRESMVHRLPVSKDGEHQFAAYREEESDDAPKVTLYSSENKRINSFWVVPSFAEILSLENEFP